MNEIKTTDSIAESWATAICAEIAKDPKSLSSHQSALQDLKLAIVKEGFDLESGIEATGLDERGDLVWELARNLPNFDTGALYSTRMSLLSLAASVFLGWLLGGLLSGFLNWFGLGGDILRAASIFGAVWATEYLSANPKSRRMVLTILGLGGLARFGTMLASGTLRLTSFSALKSAVFGAVRPNIFKGAWLLIGAVFLAVFFSKKIGALDLPAFKASLIEQIDQELKLVRFILKELNARDEALALCEQKLSSGEAEANAKKSQELAMAMTGILDTMDKDKRQYLSEKLAHAGFEIKSLDDDYLIWNSREHADSYNTVGLVNDGDRCRILKRAASVNGKIIKGNVQRVAGIGDS